VVGNGTVLRFQIPPADYRTRFVLCESADEADIRRLVHLLPHEMSPEFAAELADHRVFQHKLERLSRPPRVTFALVAINIIVFLLLALAGAGIFVPDGDVVARWGS